ncbi:MAG: alpha-mannosidase, partial [Bacteroidales bacterium]|nr:alpha-mannosidase [Bacteroidales bacterium]
EKLMVVVDPQPAKSALLPEEASFFSVDAPNVSISAIKKAEDTNEAIVRFFETGIGDTQVTLNSFFSIIHAEKTNLIEYEGTPVEASKNRVPLKMGSHSIETVKLLMK